MKDYAYVPLKFTQTLMMKFKKLMQSIVLGNKMGLHGD